MTLEDTFERILRIYPKPFLNRFGEELRLGFQDEINSDPTDIDIYKFLGDTLTSAVWERLQATTWLYWCCAVLLIFLTQKVNFIRFFPNSLPFWHFVNGHNNLLYFILLTLTILLRLRREPTRLEWLGMGFFIFPIILPEIGLYSQNLGLVFSLIQCLGMVFFAISHQGTKDLDLPMRFLKVGFGLKGLSTLAFLIAENLNMLYSSENIVPILSVSTTVVEIIFYGALLMALLWRSRAAKIA
jgi:hypothetical protein